MLPPKNGKPITFKPTQQLRERTEDCADTVGLSLSDYVRKAVEEYNKKFPNFDSTHKNNTVSKEEPKSKCDNCFYVGNLSDVCNKCDDYVYYKPKQDKPKSTMVKSFGKGGKK